MTISCSHYLFDFDGTLVDSMPYWAKAMLDVLDDHGIDYPKNIITIITPMGLDATCDYFVKLGMEGTRESIRGEIYAQLTPNYEKVILAKAGVKEGLLSLKARGKHLHVLTASPHLWLDVCLKRNGIYDLFDHVWSCEDFPTTKTDPAIYPMAAQRMGTTVEDVVFLDDNINAVRAGKRGGMMTLGVFDPTSAQDEALFRAECDGYIVTFDEL